MAVFTEPDALSLHVLQAPESVCLGASPKEYLNATRLIEVAKETGERYTGACAWLLLGAGHICMRPHPRVRNARPPCGGLELPLA